MQDAIVRRLRDQIKKHTIISRFAGYVTAEHTEVGQWVTRGDPVAEVVALDEVEIVAKVVESQIPFVHVGDSVRVEVPSLPDQLFTGTVSAVVPQADTRSRTFPVKVTVQNEIPQAGNTAVEGRHAGSADAANRAILSRPCWSPRMPSCLSEPSCLCVGRGLRISIAAAKRGHASGQCKSSCRSSWVSPTAI